MQACEILRNKKENLLKRWEELSVAKLPKAENLTRSAIRDHIPEVFEQLCGVLKLGLLIKPDEMSKIHARQRKLATHYSLAEIMDEYSRLKDIIFDELTEAAAVTLAEFRLIDKFFDSALGTATVEFVALREHELNTVTASLVSMNQDLETFAAIAAHDLRSPASTILSYASLLGEESSPSGELAGRAIATIQKTASRMLELIDQLLDYAKIGKKHLSRTPFPLKDALNEAIDNLGLQIKESSSKVRAGDLPIYNGDKILFRQIFQNLISNSITFGAKDHPCEVSIEATETNGKIRLTIEDNGSGFDPKLSEEIFQPFKRGTNRPDTRGSGLGLATVKKIVELHGGKVWSTGEINRGAKFTIELPKT